MINVLCIFLACMGMFAFISADISNFLKIIGCIVNGITLFGIGFNAATDRHLKNLKEIENHFESVISDLRRTNHEEKK